MLETELIEMFWPNKIQPRTENPLITTYNGMLHATCKTKGACIGYKYMNIDMQPHLGWRPYTKPLKIEKGQEINWIAHRIGFLPSLTKKYKSEP